MGNGVHDKVSFNQAAKAHILAPMPAYVAILRGFRLHSSPRRPEPPKGLRLA